jgi:tetratricopeptide (TPR) repeat protein
LTDRRTEFADQARACLRNGQISEALGFARQALELAPTDTDSLTVLGAALSRADMPDEATEVLEKATKIEPGNPKHRYNLAAHLFRFGWKEEAQRHVSVALDLDPDYGKAKELLRRIERDQQTPPLMRFNTPSGGSVTEAPPVQTTPTDTFFPTRPPRPKHSVALLARLGKAWDLIFIGIFAIQAGFMAFALSSMFELGLEPTYDALSGTTPYTGAWLAFTIAYILDLFDRRPSGSYVILAVMTILLTTPVSLLAFLPLLGAVMFAAYMIGTRKE